MSKMGTVQPSSRQGLIKDSYSPNGVLKIILHEDGDIGFVITKGSTIEDFQSVDITLACGAGGGAFGSGDVVKAVHNLIAACTAEKDKKGGCN